MGFLDTDFDLHGTPFSQEDLAYAREYWMRIVGQVDPQWLIEPTGRLAVHWHSDTVPSAVRLIDTARLLFALANSISRESHSTFGEKLKALLRSDGVQYRENVTELIVGGLLTRLGAPLQMERPSTSQRAEAARARNVDYGVDWGLEQKAILIEATVFHVQRLLDWEAAVLDLKRQFEQAVVGKGLNRALTITAPLELTRKTLSVVQMSQGIDAITNSERGQLRLPLGMSELQLEWAPAPHFSNWTIEAEENDHGFCFTMGHGVEVAALAATTVRLSWPGDAEELINRSLRNTLDHKRCQFDLATPYLLMTRLLSDRLPIDNVTDLLIRRIFSNERYARISAVGLLKLSCAQDTGFRPCLYLVLNPQARNPLPDTFVTALVNGGSS